MNKVLQCGMKHIVMLWQKFVERISMYIKIFYFQSGDAEREKYNADIDQQHAEKVYVAVEKLVAKFQKDYKRSINTSKYFNFYTAINKNYILILF